MHNIIFEIYCNCRPHVTWEIGQNWQKWPKLHKVGKGCIKLHKVKQSCIKLPKMAESCIKLPKIAESCIKLPTVA